ncbi:MAG: hypothetical protein Q7J54_07195 [Candidatus Woesearchaeota archaeon]|nr:hypothetical protein [Candidatus Woesearchaeota archaeon]
MIIRMPKAADAEQIYEHFIRAQVSKQNLDRSAPKRGFYEYHLSYDDIAARARMPFSLVMEKSEGRLVGYVLAYSLSYIPEFESKEDSIHNSLKAFDKNAVYIDQLFLHPDYPLTLAARLSDAWEHMIRGEKVPGVICAIPEEPWLNQSSTRLVLARGFSRKTKVESEGVTLRLFAKPYLPLNNSFEGFGDDLILDNKNY